MIQTFSVLLEFKKIFELFGSKSKDMSPYFFSNSLKLSTSVCVMFSTCKKDPNKNLNVAFKKIS